MSQNHEGAKEVLVHSKYGAGIAESATIGLRGKDKHRLAVGKELVAIFHNLVRTHHEAHVEDLSVTPRWTIVSWIRTEKHQQG